MTKRSLAVVTAGLRNPSSTRMLADRLAEATVRALGAHGVETELRVIEVREHNHALMNMLSTGFPSPELEKALQDVVTADGLIAVTPIFSGSYSGPFKTFFDVVEDGALAGMPTLLAATAGTARHSLAIDHAMRPLFAYLRAAVVPTGVFGATEDFGAGTAQGADDGTPPIAVRVDRAARELAPLVAAREAREQANPFGEPTPFERLLAGGS